MGRPRKPRCPDHATSPSWAAVACAACCAIRGTTPRPSRPSGSTGAQRAQAARRAAEAAARDPEAVSAQRRAILTDLRAQPLQPVALAELEAVGVGGDLPSRYLGAYAVALGMPGAGDAIRLRKMWAGELVYPPPVRIF